MTIQIIAGIIALTLSIAANVPYVIETIQGKTKPERISWFIWTLLGVIYFSTAVLEGGGDSIYGWRVDRSSSRFCIVSEVWGWRTQQV